MIQTEGCSGAEIISICQDAALTTMNEDPNAPFVRLFSVSTSQADRAGQRRASDGVGAICQETDYPRDDCFLRVMEGSEWGKECLGGMLVGTVVMQCILRMNNTIRLRYKDEMKDRFPLPSKPFAEFLLTLHKNFVLETGIQLAYGVKVFASGCNGDINK